MPLPQLKYTKRSYPQSPNKELPDQYWVGIFCAPRGVGKTYAICSLIHGYEVDPPINSEGRPMAIRSFVITPTWEANDVFRSLNSIDRDDVFEDYTHDVIHDIVERIQEEKRATEDYQRRMKLWKRFKRIRDIRNLSTDDLLDLDLIGFEEPEPPRYPDGVANFLCVDDMVGSSIMTRAGRNPFLQLCLRNRHVGLNIAIVGQSLKTIPKTLRQNSSIYFIGKAASKAHFNEIYEEVGSAFMTEEQFEKMYDKATSEPYGALVVDFTKPPERRFSISWREYLDIPS